MSTILLQWLKEQNVCNGDGSIFNNFIRIEPTLKRLSINFTAKEACAITEKSNTVICNVLYKIYIALNNKILHDRLDVGSHSLIQLKTIDNEMYKNNLKQLLPRQGDISLAQLVTKYEARNAESHCKTDLSILKTREECDQRIQKARRKRSKVLRAIKAEIIAQSEGKSLYLNKKQTKDLDGGGSINTSKMGKEALTDIEEFERRILRSEVVEAELSFVKDADRGLLEYLHSFRGSSEGEKHASLIDLPMMESSERYKEGIRARLRSEQKMTEERQKRRRRVIVRCLQEQQAQQDEARNRRLTERLERHSRLESRLYTQLEQTMREKAVIQENQRTREEEYAKMREAEFLAFLDHQEAKLSQAKKEESLTLAVLHNVWANQRAVSRKAAHMRHLTFVERDVVPGLLQFVFRIADYRAYTKCLIPAKLVKEWKLQFIRGELSPMEVSGSTEDQNVDNGSEDLLKVASDQDSLDERYYQEYRNLEGEWSLTQLGTISYAKQPGESAEATYGQPLKWNRSSDETVLRLNGLQLFDFERPEWNPILDWIVLRIHNLITPQSPPLKPPLLPDLPVRAALLGKPLSGKSTIIKLMEEAYGYVEIDPMKLVQEAIVAFKSRKSRDDIETPTRKELGSPKKQFESALSTLGESLDELLGQNKKVPDEILVQLIFEKIKSLSDGTRFILNGFPNTIGQARMLELWLTVDQPCKAGIPDESIHTQVMPHVVKGLNMVIYLDVEDDEVLRRGAGQFVTETSGVAEAPDSVGLENTECKSADYSSCALSLLPLRLDIFNKTWVELQKFYGDESGILHTLNGSVNEALNLDEKLSFMESCNEMHHLIELILSPMQSPSLDELINVTEDKSLSLAENVRMVTRSMVDVDSQTASPTPKSKQSSKKKSKTRSVSSGGSDSSTRSQSGKRKTKSGKDPKKTKSNQSSASNKGPEKHKSTPESPSRSRSRSGSGSNNNEGRRGRSRTKEEVADRQSEDLSSVPSQAVSTLPSPEPCDEGWVFVSATILPDCASAIHQFWSTSELQYRDNLKTVLRSIRDISSKISPHLHEAKASFYKYLQRPDSKQAYVSQFQSMYNAVSDDMRADIQTKAELHCRVDELKDSLYEQLDEAKAANDSKWLPCLDGSGYLVNQIGLLVNSYLVFMQTELNTFQNRMQILRDYYSAMERHPEVDEEGLPIESAVGAINNKTTEYTWLPLVLVQADSVSLFDQDDQTSSTTPQRQASVVGSIKSQANTSRRRSFGVSSALPEDYASPADDFIGQLPPEYATNRRFISAHSTLKDISAALIKTGPGTKCDEVKFGGGRRKSESKKPPTGKPSGQGRGSLTGIVNLNIDQSAAPSDSDALFLYNACLCSFQVITNQMQAVFVQRENEAKEDGFVNSIMPKETSKAPAPPPTKEKPRSGSAGKRSPAGKKTGSAKKAAKKNEAIANKPDEDAQTTASEEEMVARTLKQSIRREHVAAVERQVSSSIFRLTLIRIHGCTVLAELKQRILQAKSEMIDWIGERTANEHQAVEKLIELLHNAIEMEQRLSYPLCLEGDQFYVQEQPKESLPLTQPSTITTPETEVFLKPEGYFTLDQLNQLLKQFRRLAPNGHMEAKTFVTCLQPILQERLLDFMDTSNPEVVEELANNLAQRYSSTVVVTSSLSDKDTPNADQASLRRPSQKTTNTVSEKASRKRKGLNSAKIESSAIPTTTTYPKLAYVDWRRFLLAATQFMHVLFPFARPTQNDLVQLAKRLLELREPSVDSESSKIYGLVGVSVSRAQFEFAPFAWWPTSNKYINELHDFVYSIFASSSVQTTEEPSSEEDGSDLSVIERVETKENGIVSGRNITSRKFDVGIDCGKFLLYMAMIGAPTTHCALMRAFSCLTATYVPHVRIHGQDGEYSNQPMQEENLEINPEVYLSLPILKEVVNFGAPLRNLTHTDFLQNSQITDDPETVAMDLEDVLRELFTEINAVVDNTNSELPIVPLSELFQHPKSATILLTAMDRYQLLDLPEPFVSLVSMQNTQVVKDSLHIPVNNKSHSFKQPNSY